MNDNIKSLTIGGVAVVVIQIIISCGLFVTFPQMAAYAVSKDNFNLILEQLKMLDLKVEKINEKIDRMKE